jgi:uncharacterized protein (DUF2147 family)
MPLSKSRISCVMLSLLMMSPVSSEAAQPSTILAISGTWLNPKGTITVKTGDCRGRLCGWVSWASFEALQDAKESGVDKLVGTELLQDYQSNAPGKWSGTVYIPDLGHRFNSRITQLNANRLKISGCMLGGFICKSQIWHKVA